MMLLKSAIKPLYQGFNSTVRLGFLKSRERSLWIATYHRVLPADDPRAAREEPGMIVEPETLRLHLRLFHEHFEVVRLGEWIEAAKRDDPLPRAALALTFDDGWADNYEFALPLLKESRTPATLFLVSDMIGSERRFWPNRVSEIVAERGAGFFSKLFPLCREVPAQLDGQSRAWQIIAALKHFSDEKIHCALAAFEAKHRLRAVGANGLLNWQEAEQMAASGLVDMGSHTRNHLRLTNQVSDARLQDEIVNSKAVIEQQLKTPVTLFCYPNGDHCAPARELVSTHYRAGLTTARGVNLASGKTTYNSLKRFSLHQDASRTGRQLLSALARSA